MIIPPYTVGKSKILGWVENYCSGEWFVVLQGKGLVRIRVMFKHWPDLS